MNPAQRAALAHTVLVNRFSKKEWSFSHKKQQNSRNMVIITRPWLRFGVMTQNPCSSLLKMSKRVCTRSWPVWCYSQLCLFCIMISCDSLNCSYHSILFCVLNIAKSNDSWFISLNALEESSLAFARQTLYLFLKYSITVGVEFWKQEIWETSTV